MKFSAWVQHHRRSILFFLLTLALVGFFTAFKLPVTLFPSVDFPRAAVTLDAGDRPAEQMALQVTMPVEEAVRRVPGVRDIRSTTSRGSAELSVNFGWGTDMAIATLQVNAAIAQILPSLPVGTTMLVRRMDPTVFPIIAYSLTSDTVSLTALTDFAQYQLRPLFSGVDGVARIQTVGGAVEEYRATVDPARLQAYGMTISDIAKALSAANVVTAVGRMEDHYKLYLGISDTRLQSLNDIRQTILRSSTNGLVRLEDLATVSVSTVPQWIRVNADGQDAVLLNVYQQPGGNSVQIARDIAVKLHNYGLPKGVKISKWYDQSQLVVESAASVRDAILIGVGLAALVLFIFLRNVKITLIAVIVVPAVLAATIVVLYFLGMSFNIMTLGGMAAAVGLIIDDAIVMLEQIVRRLRAASEKRQVMSAALEFTRPLAGSSAATLVIFIPLAFLTGVTGAFFKALSLTMASSLLISFLITWLAVPILADHLLKQKDAEQEEGGSITTWIHEKYSALLSHLLRRPLLILVGVAPLFLTGWVAYHQVGSGFMPAMDEGGFILDYRSEPGTSLTETDRLLRQVEVIIKNDPNVQTYSRRTGTQLGGGITEANQGDFFIRLKPLPRNPVDQVMDEIRNRIEMQVPGLNIELAQLMEDMIGDLTAVPQPIEIKIYADDQSALQAIAQKTAGQIAKIPGVVDVKNGINPAGDALEIHVDRAKAALEGVSPDSVTKMLSDYLTGAVTTQVQSSVKMIGVRVWIPEKLRVTQSDVEKLMLRSPDGHIFPLRRVAQVVTVSGQPEIDRDNLKRMVAVTARISGRDMGSAIRDVQRVMTRPDMLPQGIYYELGGLYKQQQIAFRGLIQVFAAAVALVFLLLLFLYERFRVALAIMAIPLMSISAIFIGLWATGIELNISAMMGMTMIVGIVTEVAIFYFSEYQSIEHGMDRESALIEAGKNRMRPIAMTTIAAILTLLPLAFAIGQGSQMQQPLAIAIISGLIVQLPLVLLVMPVLYNLLQVRQPS
ncbi:cobalt-zinc-cadmium resistance protein CzcA [mine drainage metagenome]|uniref:Cobalt-zinc-cadmium resistance protein CzcA n=1 Tax=mine drainage metagenome TaxID=410659 RepID=A0A1J5R4X4_9ZZZZ